MASKDIQFSLKTTIFGRHRLVVRRKNVLGESPGTFCWGKWRNATLIERDKVLAKLHTL